MINPKNLFISKINRSFCLPFSDNIILTYFFFVIGETLWLNPRPDSTLMTRVLEFEVVKETEQKNKASVDMLRSLNTSLVPTIITTLEESNRGGTVMEDLIDGVQDLAISDHNIIKCGHRVFCTMVDGKVKIHCSDKTSSTRECPICGAGVKQLNMSAEELTEIAADVNNELLSMGLSVMHGWIKSMEFILHAATTQCIGYRLAFRQQIPKH